MLMADVQTMVRLFNEEYDGAAGMRVSNHNSLNQPILIIDGLMTYTENGEKKFSNTAEVIFEIKMFLEEWCIECHHGKKQPYLNERCRTTEFQMNGYNVYLIERGCECK